MADPQERIGQQLGKYRLVRLLGQGGFADVYLAEHIHLETFAAVKVLSTRLTGDNVEHFRTEARTVAHLVHPHIVRVLDFGVEDNIPYLAMDYAPNGTLRQRHPKGTKLQLGIIVSYVKQVAEALAYAHERRLIHRDIKPENMLLGDNDQVLLSDFGIALISQSTRYQNTQEVIGTAAYMAPEQLQGKPRRASDQYALGIVVYEWLCGDHPFHGSFTEIYSQHLFVPPPPLSERAPGLSSVIENVVFTALAKDPQQRFASIQAFAVALEQACLSAQGLPTIVQSQPLRSPPPSQYTWPAAIAPAASQPLQSTISNPQVSSSQASQHRVSRRTIVLGVAALVAAASGITWLALSHSSSSTTPTGSTASPSPRPTSPPSQGTTFYSIQTSSNIRVLAWSPNGKRIALGCDDSTARVWDASAGSNVLTYRGHTSYVEGVTWSPDSSRIASGSADATVQIWNPSNGSLIYTYRGHSAWVNRVSWSPNGQYIASGDQASAVRVWNANTGNTLVTYRGHTNVVFAVAWSPDSTRVASCGYDGTLQVWVASTGSLISKYAANTYLYGLSWSPDGRFLAVGRESPNAWVVNANTGNVVSAYNVPSQAVTDVAWSPDGSRIAAGSHNQAVYVLNATTGTNLYTYTNVSQASQNIDAITWSPDSQRVASGGNNGSVQVWQAV
jgi:eukaryotic-like serine/threonine-protein kinase